MILNEISKDDLLSDSFSNSIIAMSSVFALRDVILTTPEQKKIYNSKQKDYIKKFFLEYADKYQIENREQLLEKLLK